MDRTSGCQTLIAGAGLTQKERHHLATVALHAAFVEIFSEGFFHGDPHPGNFVVTDDLRLGLLDFGMVGTITERQREHFFDFIASIAEKNSEGILAAWWAMGITEPESERAALKRGGPADAKTDTVRDKVGDANRGPRRSFVDCQRGPSHG